MICGARSDDVAPDLRLAVARHARGSCPIRSAGRAPAAPAPAPRRIAKVRDQEQPRHVERDRARREEAAVMPARCLAPAAAGRQPAIALPSLRERRAPARRSAGRRGRRRSDSTSRRPARRRAANGTHSAISGSIRPELARSRGILVDLVIGDDHHDRQEHAERRGRALGRHAEREREQRQQEHRRDLGQAEVELRRGWCRAASSRRRRSCPSRASSGSVHSRLRAAARAEALELGQVDRQVVAGEGQHARGRETRARCGPACRWSGGR